MTDLFFFLVAGMFATYVVLDGFDLGAGVLHLVIAKTDAERQTVLATIGPYWDGNEVWLVAAGGTMMLAFPRALGMALSGFYLGVFFLIWSLSMRGISIELRNHLKDDLWRAFWDFLFFASSAIVPILLGIVLGNLVRGVPIDANGTFSLPLFAGTDARFGLVDAYTMSVGLYALAILTNHGAIFVAFKSVGPVFDRSKRIAVALSWGTALVWPMVLVWSLRKLPMSPLGWSFSGLAAVALVARIFFVRSGRLREAFFASSAFIGLALIGIAIVRYPILLGSIDGTRDVRAVDVSAPKNSLITALRFCLGGLLLAIGYSVNLFRIHRGKVRVGPDDH